MFGHMQAITVAWIKPFGSSTLELFYLGFVALPPAARDYSSARNLTICLQSAGSSLPASHAECLTRNINVCGVKRQEMHL